jgi:hypothetical protein
VFSKDSWVTVDKLFTQNFDAENRLTSIIPTSGVAAK